MWVSSGPVLCCPGGARRARSWGPIVLIWDNLPNHVSRTMRQLITARSWLTVIQLPAYAPELNPVEGACGPA
jgi:transposase